MTGRQRFYGQLSKDDIADLIAAAGGSGIATGSGPPPETNKAVLYLDVASGTLYYNNDGDLTQVTASWLLRGAWTPNTAYTRGDLFTQDGSTYIVTTNHTSAATFAVTSNVTLLAAKGSDGRGPDPVTDVLPYTLLLMGV